MIRLQIEKSVLNSAIGFNQEIHSVLRIELKNIIQFSGFVFLPIHTPFPISIGVALLIIVVPPSIIDKRMWGSYLIFNF